MLGGTGPPRFCRQLGGGKPYHGGGYARLAGGPTTLVLGLAKGQDAEAHHR